MQRLTQYWPYLIYSMVGIATIFGFDGTADSGDSITHYLISRHAPQHPQLFLDHWAKPVFVILSCAWAQFGIVGMKFFNLTVTLLAARFTQLLAQRIGIANDWTIPVFFLFAPLNYVVTFSGLTEPLFSLFLAVALCLAAQDRQEWAAVVVSFLPFVRSEGLLMVAVFLCLFIFLARWKAAIATLSGHMLFTIIGLLAGKDLLWTITEIPYASINSPYGHGDLTSFPAGLVFVLGIPLLILFLFGFLVLVLRLVGASGDKSMMFLIGASFMALFLFHTLAWTFGMFNSMGLKRVMVAVMPSMAIMVLLGFNLLTENRFWKSTTVKRTVKVVILLTIVLFPFTENHAAIHWNRNVSLHPDQLLEQHAGELILKNSTDNQRHLYSSHYLSVVLDLDHFDPNVRTALCSWSFSDMRHDDIVVWNNWTEQHCEPVSLERLQSEPRLKQLGSFQTTTSARSFQLVVFRYE